jgi:hypothetical protein
MSVVISGAEPVELTTEEVSLLRFTCDLSFDEESAFGPLMERRDQDVLRRSAKSLVEKGLADPKTYRPHRELLRRLLVVAQPDSRIILLASGHGRSERLLDAYGRAGAYVAYLRIGYDHRLGPPLELVDVFDEVISHFTPRRSTGDFIDLRLTSAEYFAFAAVVGAERARDSFTKLPQPSEEQLAAARRGLIEKGALEPSGALRGYLHDLALGLAGRTRHVITRIDFGAEDWFVRDSTMVHVPGSLFQLEPVHEGGIAIRELDPEGLKDTVRTTIESI